MNYVFLTGKKEQDGYLKSFAGAIGAKTVYTRHYISVLPPRNNNPAIVKKKKVLPGTSGLIFSGILRGNAHVLDIALQNNIPYYYVDHAYFGAGYKNPHWMRVTKNGFCQNTILPDAKTNRLDSLNIHFKDYNFRSNRNIVVLPPSNSVARVFNQTGWEEAIVKKIRNHTDRPIVVRRKDGPVMDKLLVDIKGKEKYHYNESIEETLDNAYCVVAYNSSLALRALEKGIPVICERHCPAYPLSHSIEEIENLKEKDRLPLFASLAWGQFTMEEISNPKTFTHINNIIQWKGPIR
jgi:hypothetical protein